MAAESEQNFLINSNSISIEYLEDAVIFEKKGPASSTPKIEASYLRKLIRDIIAEDKIIARIFIRDLHVYGKIDLTFCEIPSFIINNCELEVLDVSYSEISYMEIYDCHIAGIEANATKFDHDIKIINCKIAPLINKAQSRLITFCFHACAIGGEINISNINPIENTKQVNIHFCRSKINGSATFTNAFINNLGLDGVRIEQNLCISTNCVIDSEISAINANVSGHLYIHDSQIGTSTNSNKFCFKSEGLNTGGAILLKNTIFCGELNIIHSNVGVNFEIDSCVFRRKVDHYRVINLTGTAIKGDVIIKNKSRTYGEFVLERVRIGGNLDIDRSNFNCNCNKIAYPFVAFDMQAGGGVIIKSSIFSKAIKFAQAKINGNVYIEDVYFEIEPEQKSLLYQNSAGISLCRSQISGLIMFVNFGCNDVWTHIDMRNSVIGLFHPYINIKSHCKFYLSSTKFERLEIASQTDITKMHSFLEKNAERLFDGSQFFDPQPFVHFAQHLYNSGWVRESDQVIICSKKLQNRSTQNWSRYIRTFLYGLLFDFGYGRSKSIFIVLAWILIGTIGVFVSLDRNQLIIDSKVISTVVLRSNSGSSPQTAVPVTADSSLAMAKIPCGDNIEPLFFAIELMLPIFDFGQKNQCTIRMREDGEKGPAFMFEYFWWWLAKYLYVVIGWVLVSLAVLTVSGTLRDRLDK